MKKTNIVEFETVGCNILEDRVDEKSGDHTMRAEVLWQRANTPNSNKRYYTKEILEREIKRISEKCKNREVWGSAYHPKDKDIETVDSSHLWTDVRMEEDGTCIGTIEVIPTRVGKDIQVMLRHGKIGLSSRGIGTLTDKEIEYGGQKTFVKNVDDNFQLVSPGDFVLGPSVDGAGVRRILESRLNEAEDLNSDREENMSKELEEKVSKLEADVKERDNKLKENETKLAESIVQIEHATAALKSFDALKEKYNGFLRQFVITASEFDGVLPEVAKTAVADSTKSTAPEKKVEEEIEKLKSEKEKVEKELSDMKASAEAKQIAEAKEKTDVELQKKLYESFETFLKSDKFASYAVLLRSELVTEGKINVATVEELEPIMEKVKTKLANIIVEAKKAKIICGDLSEKGIIEDAEGKSKEKDVKQLTEERRLYAEAVRSGFTGSFENYKEKFLKG